MKAGPVSGHDFQAPATPPTPRAQYNHLLPTVAQSVDVVLVSPRNPLNIGATARAMANFGFSQLTVVAPYAPHWREARSAIGAPELLQEAKECATLAEAVAQSTLVIGTGTLTHRKPEQRVVELPQLAPLLQQHLASNGRIALVFGPEKHGLTRDDLSWCHLLVEIPTHPQQPSMNLGQAVAVCLYELSSRVRSDSSSQSNIAISPATKEAAPRSADLDRLAGVIEETMQCAGYSPTVMQSANSHDLRLLLRRLAGTERDTRRMLGLFRRILFRLQRVPKEIDS